MRAILSAAVLLLCLSTAAQETGYSALRPGTFHIGGGRTFASLVEIESSQTRDKRESATLIAANFVEEDPAVAATQNPAAVETQTAIAPAAQSKPAPTASTNASTDQLPNAGEADTAPPVPLDQLCSALLTSAQDNNLPVAFFANLIWQESRLRDNAVSPKGALGIAQFMPKVALASGLQNPFDPRQALAASARMLRVLRDQFGNLGFVAAAYNAGAKRVSEWLQHGRTLPRETRGYVVDVTGRSVEQWQKAPLNGDDLHFVRRLPCRDFPAFAELEQTQQQQAQQQQQDARQAKAEAPKPQQPKPAEKLKVAERTAPAAPLKRMRVVERKLPRAEHKREDMQIAERDHAKREDVRIAERDHARHEAKVRIRRAEHERHRRA